jgi:hypothetical protein
MYEVKFQREVDGFYIYVPTSLLKFAAETHEDYPMVVIDQDKFVDSHCRCPRKKHHCPYGPADHQDPR